VLDGLARALLDLDRALRLWLPPADPTAPYPRRQVTSRPCLLCGYSTATRGELCLRCSPLVAIPNPRTRELAHDLLAERYDLSALAREAFHPGVAP
jgi:hypothetical protein